MKKSYVLDTNACRNIVYGCSCRAMYEHKVHGVISFPVITAIELLRHLKFDDPAYSNCEKALCLLVDKTMGISGIDVVIPDMFTLLKNYFSVSGRNDELSLSIIGISDKIAKGDLIEDQSMIISNIIKYNDGIIGEMINNMQYYLDSLSRKEDTPWNYIIQNSELRKNYVKNLNSGRFHEYIAMALVRSVIPESELEKRMNDEIFKKFQLDFSATIDFFVQKILRLLVSSTAAVDKLSSKERDRTSKRPKWNSFYDMQLIAGVEYYNCEGSEVKALFVTDERDIMKSFKNVGKGELVMKLEDYIGESAFEKK